jgi:hypothetical protein
MTEREIAELLVRQNNCEGISCRGYYNANTGTVCPLFHLCQTSAVSIKSNAQRWLDDHKEGV